MMRRCPQCGTAGDDVYGFCIKCGYEFPKITQDKDTCPLCGYKNPEEAEFCVKCGTPLLFKKNPENNVKVVNPIVIQKLLIFIGYFFAILGSIIGLIIAIYLITRKDPSAKKHGYIQIAIILFYLILLAIMFATGAIPPEVITDYKSLLLGNFTPLNR